MKVERLKRGRESETREGGAGTDGANLTWAGHIDQRSWPIEPSRLTGLAAGQHGKKAPALWERRERAGAAIQQHVWTTDNVRLARRHRGDMSANQLELTGGKISPLDGTAERAERREVIKPRPWAPGGHATGVVSFHLHRRLRRAFAFIG